MEASGSYKGMSLIAEPNSRPAESWADWTLKNEASLHAYSTAFQLRLTRRTTEGRNDMDAHEQDQQIKALAVARRFHEHYEQLAPQFGYATREASAVPWDDVPDQNKLLMVATVRELMRDDLIR